MLRLQSIFSVSDTLSFCSIGRTLKNIGSPQNAIFRTYVTNSKENVLSTISATNIHQVSSNRLFFRNSIWLKVSCLKEIHTQTISRCQSHKTVNIKALLKNDEEEEFNINQGKKKHSEKQLLHKQKAFHSEILKEFPEPIASLHNVYSIVQSQLKIDQALTLDYVSSRNKWTCNCRVKWPEEKEFNFTSLTKKGAASTAALQCLHWLKDIKKIKNGLPVVFDVTKIQASLRCPTRINIETEMQYRLENLLLKYENEVKPIITKAEVPERDFTEEGDERKESVLTRLKHKNIFSTFDVHPEDRNYELRRRLRNRLPLKYDLPINSFKNEILQHIEENQVLVIQGDTGCGKTTQVPKFIMDSFAEKGNASKCNIIVTQPRRISAISLAGQIARERSEQLGDVVGYKVKLQQILPKTPGAILFCTTGVLLKMMQVNPNLDGCSHIVVDEAHERKVDIDLVLALLKRLIKNNKELKIIIMSATINADLFQTYFDCATLRIPGKAYPVKMHFLEEISKVIDVKIEYEKDYYFRPQVECERIANLIQWITDNKPPGSILCFLPGWVEIVQVEKMLKDLNKSRNKQLILPIHSMLSFLDQQKIFAKPPRDTRKIILATDIAETGITVPDVVYVVDSATHKEIRWNKAKEIDTMQNYRISRANLHQRRGRAGRVQPGESFHFISRIEYEDLKPFPLPEIKCLNLDRVVLDCKLCTDDKAETFLSELLEPPDHVNVSQSVRNLVKLGAFDREENLTILGKKLGILSLPPNLGKTLIYSSIFNCVDPILTLATMFSMNIEIFRNVMLRKDEIRIVKKRFSSNSDHLALYLIYMKWLSCHNNNESLAEKFCDESGINTPRMLTVRKLMNQYADQLCAVLGIREKLHSKPSLSKYSQSSEIIKAVVLAGVDHVAKHVGFEKIRDRFVKTNRAFQDENRNSMHTTPDSVNHLRDKFSSPYLTYIKKTFASERGKTLIRDSSLISPLTVMLFCQGHVFGYERPLDDLNTDKPSNQSKDIIVKVSDKDNVSLMCSEEVASLIFRFRDSLWAVVRYLIDNERPSFALQSKELDIVDAYRNEMLTVLDQLLKNASKNMENEVEKKKRVEVDPLSVESVVNS